MNNKNLIYLYLNLLVICKSLIVRRSKSIMFNIFLQLQNCWSYSQTDKGVLIKRNI